MYFIKMYFNLYTYRFFYKIQYMFTYDTKYIYITYIQDDMYVNTVNTERFTVSGTLVGKVKCTQHLACNVNTFKI